MSLKYNTKSENVVEGEHPLNDWYEFDLTYRHGSPNDINNNSEDLVIYEGETEEESWIYAPAEDTESAFKML